MEPGFIRPDAAMPYCRGCGHGLVLRALEAAVRRAGIPPRDVAVVTDIGCVGLADSLLESPHTIHTTHGRSTAFAAGIALADAVLGPGRLKTVVLIGDGGATIGINHLVNAALMNPNMTVLIHNNMLFGMTGGQNSAFSPLGFVTSTTRGGNLTPPLDLARLLISCRAPFVARTTATDRGLSELLARALTHPGFAAVEILELCTSFATRWNPLTGAGLIKEAERAGYELGVLRDEARPTFDDGYRSAHPAGGSGARDESPDARKERPAAGAADRPSLPSTRPRGGNAGVILGGTAGERVQTAATLLARAGMLCGLHATQKNDYPVTQGSGFSLSEVIIGPDEILYTGIEQPAAVLVLSEDGSRELARNGVLERITTETLLLADEAVDLPVLPSEPVRLPFRRETGPRLAATAAVAACLAIGGFLPQEALDAAMDERFGAEAAAMRRRIAMFLHESLPPGDPARRPPTRTTR